MKEPKVFCACNSPSGWISPSEGVNPYQLTSSDLHDKSLDKTCPACHLSPWHDAYYENEQFDKEKQTMTEYITEPIDYTGCDPIIAEHLKRGQKILCKVGNYEAWVLTYDSTDSGPDRLPYLVGEKLRPSETWWEREPIPIPRPKKNKMIMPPERALPILFAAGYSFNSEGELESSPSDALFACNFQHFGKPLDTAPGWFHNHPEIIEEVDE